MARLPHGGKSFETAVQDLELLIDCARRAGVRRFVHVSVSNASLDSELGHPSPLFRKVGKWDPRPPPSR